MAVFKPVLAQNGTEGGAINEISTTPATSSGLPSLSPEQRDLLTRGLRQRFQAVQACLDRIVRSGKIPEFLKPFGFVGAQLKAMLGPVMGAECVDLAWTWFGSTDVHISTTGSLTVMDHNFSLPQGLDLLSAMGRLTTPDFPSTALAKIDANDGVRVVLVPSLLSSAVRGNEFLARRLNAHLTRASDLTIRGDGVFVQTGPDRIRVSCIVRRIDDDLLDPNCYRPDSLVGVPGLVRAWRQGLVNVLSAPGSGLANCRTFGKLISQMIAEFLGEEPLLKSPEVLECEDPETLRHVLANIKDYSIRTNDPLHPARPFFGRTGLAVEFADLLARVRRNPAAYVARPLLAEHDDRGMNLRFFASLREEFVLMPTAIGRHCQLDGGASLAIGSNEEIVPVM